MGLSVALRWGLVRVPSEQVLEASVIWTLLTRWFEVRYLPVTYELELQPPIRSPWFR
jgi:hypothetical protein